MRRLPGGVDVRRALPADAPRVRAFVRAGISSYRAWAPDWQPAEPSAAERERIASNFASPDAWILLAEEGDELVGVVALAAATLAAERLEAATAVAQPPPPGAIYLWQLFVSPAWQGRGLAGALHDLATAEARRRGFSRMVLWAAEGAQQARRFYEREGWRPTGERDPGSRLGLPIVQYELRL